MRWIFDMLIVIRPSFEVVEDDPPIIGRRFINGLDNPDIIPEDFGS
jgi:hypothetical protein